MFPGGSVDTLIDGFEGQQITILLDGGDTVGSASSGNIKVSGRTWSPVGKATITLLYDGAAWREVSRSDNF